MPDNHPTKNIIEITGYLDHLKPTRTFDDGTTIIEFVVQAENGSQPHWYILRAQGKDTQMEEKLNDCISHRVKCTCYINGKKKKTPKGFYYINELRLKAIEMV